jgi:bacterioferritin-associated ferredoxin
MAANRSVELFKSRTMNCAEAILRGFQESVAISDETLAEARAQGGGRTPEGRCGALHAALLLASAPDMQEKIRNHFVAVSGSESCREIRKQKIASCTKCVETAAQILEEELKKEGRFTDRGEGE